MIYLIIPAIIFLTLGFWYLKKNVLLPSNTQKWIEEIKQSDLPELMPGREGFAKNGEVKVCYEVIEPNGAAKDSVLMISGYGQTMLDFPRHFYNPLLESGYRIIRIDNRGVGKSSWIKDWTKETAFTLEDMASDAIAVLDELNQEKVHLIGMSMGGMISQRIAINYPERIISLTSIMSTGFYHDPELVGLPPKFKRDAFWSFIIYGLNGLKKIDQKLKLHLAIVRLLKGKGDYFFDDKLVLEKAYYENTSRNGYNKNIRNLHATAIYRSGSRYEELKKLNLPTLVIHGTDDTLVLFEHGEKYSKMIPNAKKLFIEGMGHDLPLAHTPKMVNEILALLEETQLVSNR